MSLMTPLDQENAWVFPAEVKAHAYDHTTVVDSKP